MDLSFPLSHTVSTTTATSFFLLQDGVRISQPQKLPEKLKGKTLFPHLSFKNMTAPWPRFFLPPFLERGSPLKSTSQKIGCLFVLPLFFGGVPP